MVGTSFVCKRGEDRVKLGKKKHLTVLVLDYLTLVTVEARQILEFCYVKCKKSRFYYSIFCGLSVTSKPIVKSIVNSWEK